MQQASCLEWGPRLWIWPLYLHVNQKSDDDDDDDDDARIAINHVFSCTNIWLVPRKVSEHLPCGLVFKHVPRDPGNVNARKTMVDPYNII